MTPALINDDFSFLPHFFEEEDLYIIDFKPEAASVGTTPAVETKQPISAPKPSVTVPVTPEKIVEKVETRPLTATEPLPIKTTEGVKKHKKVVILVGYQGTEGIPTRVKDDFEKIFIALSIEMPTVEIINVLSPLAPNIDRFTFEYLILMGGNGRNLSFLQDYTGTRNRYDIAAHKNVRILFAENMDIYFSSRDLKVKFWGKLKELFR